MSITPQKLKNFPIMIGESPLSKMVIPISIKCEGIPRKLIPKNTNNSAPSSLESTSLSTIAANSITRGSETNLAQVDRRMAELNESLEDQFIVTEVLSNPDNIIISLAPNYSLSRPVPIETPPSEIEYKPIKGNPSLEETELTNEQKVNYDIEQKNAKEEAYNAQMIVQHFNRLIDAEDTIFKRMMSSREKMMVELTDKIETGKRDLENILKQVTETTEVATKHGVEASTSHVNDLKIVSHTQNSFSKKNADLSKTLENKIKLALEIENLRSQYQSRREDLLRGLKMAQQEYEQCLKNYELIQSLQEQITLTTKRASYLLTSW